MTYTDEKKWIDSNAPAAIAAMKKWGVPASVTLAQACCESNWGQSKLSQPPNNNFFGIKARQGQKYCEFKTTEVIKGKPQRVPAHFAAYDSVADSFDRHGELLATLPCYRKAMAVASDALAFALQLQLCGYATDPNYAKKLSTLIAEFDLTRYDKQAKEAA